MKARKILDYRERKQQQVQAAVFYSSTCRAQSRGQQMHLRGMLG